MNDLIKARKLFNILRFIDDLYSINCGGESQIILIPITYPEELELQ